MALTSGRINSVSVLLAEHGHQAGRTPNNETAGAVGKIDYRRARVVLVQPVGGPGLNSCAGRSGAETCPSTVDAVFGRVDTLLGEAIAKLASPGSLSAAERRLVKDLFDDDADGAIAEVAANMADLRRHLADTRSRRQEPPTHRSRPPRSIAAGTSASRRAVPAPWRSTGATAPPPR